MVLDLQEKVAAAVKMLKERGLVSPYLRSFVVARINLLRWIKGEPPPLEEVLKTMRERARKFNIEKIKPQDLAAGGPPDEEAWKALHTIGVRCVGSLGFQGEIGLGFQSRPNPNRTTDSESVALPQSETLRR